MAQFKFGSVDELVDILHRLREECLSHANSARAAKATRAESLYLACGDILKHSIYKIENLPI